MEGGEDGQTVGSFLSFLREHLSDVNLTSHLSHSDSSTQLPHFDLTTHLSRCFGRYWEERALSHRIAALRTALLAAATALPHKAHPLRFLSMWLADPANSPPAPPKTKGKPAAVTDATAVTDEEAAAADLPPQAAPEELIRSALFPASTKGLPAPLLDQLNRTLETMLTLLPSHYPPHPFKFLSLWLRSQPLRLSDAPAAPPASMNHSEVLRSWPLVRKAIVGSPVLAEVRRLVESLLKPLLKRGLPVDSAPFGYTLCYMASAQGNLEVVKLALKEGADLHRLSKDNTSPLEVSAAMGHHQVVSLLLESGAHFGLALHYASASGQVGSLLP